MILNTALLRELIVREMLWPTGTERRENTDDEKKHAAQRADAVIKRYLSEARDIAYKDTGAIFREDRSRGR